MLGLISFGFKRLGEEPMGKGRNWFQGGKRHRRDRRICRLMTVHIYYAHPDLFGFDGLLMVDLWLMIYKEPTIQPPLPSPLIR